MNDQTETSHTGDAQSDEFPRRGFLTRFFAAVIGAVAGLVPVVAGTIFYFDPLLRKVKKKGGFIKMNVTVDALPKDGSPQLFKVFDDVIDAWNKFPNVEVGSVWLRRDSDGSLSALSSICPHLGCAVDYRQAERDFYCPCHQSAYSLAGDKKNEIPPRGMDTLQFKVDENQAIWIKYEKFRATIPEKTIIS